MVFLCIGENFHVAARQLSFASDAWDRFFLSLPAARVERYAIGIYLAAAVISSVISYCILELAGYRHSLGIAVLIFIGGLAITAYQWHKKEESICSNGIRRSLKQF